MKKFYLLLIAFISLLVLPVYAMPSAETDNILDINKDYNDTALFAGNTVGVNSTINGLGLYAGQQLTVKGSADYGFIAGQTVSISDYKTKDLFAAGSTINIKDVDVRNIYAAAESITISSDANDLYIAGNNITIKGEYNNVYVEANSFEIDGKIYGKLYINEDAKQNIKEGSTVAKTETYVNPETKREKKDIDMGNFTFKLIVNGIITKLFRAFKGLVNLIILGCLTILIFKGIVTRINESSEGAGSIFAHFGIGLGLLIIVPIISIILLFTGFVSGLGFVAIMLYVLGIYLSGVVGSIYLGKVIFKNMNEYLRFIIIAVIMSIIYLIPIIGGLVKFFMLCFSLGLMGHICLPEKKKGK